MSDNITTFLNAQLQRYELREKLGTGGMARVYKGYDRNLDRDVAIKILHDHLAEDPMFKERFEREAKFVASINHPNIVQMFDYDMLKRGEDTLYYMVMSYVPGKTLRQVLEEYSDAEELMPRSRVFEIMRDVSSALGYAHEKGMIHRDVKPANIIIQQDGKAILTDFGIARMVAGAQFTQEGLTVGTPAYMSPEQATGEMVDGRTDIYALGIILYEMLTGRTPFSDDGSLSVLLKHLNEPVPVLSEQLGEDLGFLDAVIFKALAKSPEDRYQTADALADDLKLVFKGETPTAFGENTRAFSIPRTLSGKRPESRQTQTTTLVMQTVQVARSPFGILGIGLAVIGLIFLISMIANQDSDAEAEATTPRYFSTFFAPDDALRTSWPEGDFLNLSRTFTDEGYVIGNRQFRTATTTIFDGPVYDEFGIAMRGRLLEGSDRPSAFGIIFNYVDDDNYNVFAIDGVGRYSLWVREAGTWVELRNPEALEQDRWTPSEFINPIGEENVLQLATYGDSIIGYINGEGVIMLEDDTLTEGQVGIYVASTEDANATVVVDMYTVMEAPSSMTSVEAMTLEDVEAFENQSRGSSMTSSMTGEESTPEATDEPDES